MLVVNVAVDLFDVVDEKATFEANTVFPSLKSIDPAGTPPADVPLTVAVKVTVVPKLDGFVDEVKLTEVLSLSVNFHPA